MRIIQSILTNNPCYKAGKKITVKGLMLHSIGCAQPDAKVFVKRWNSADYNRACVHAFIDGNTGDVYQCLPWNHRGWHGGGSSNNTHIGVEMCEPACIKYVGGATFTCSDIATAKAVAQRTYDTAVALFAHLCKTYNLDPLADGVIVSHSEGHKRGIASNHADPEHLWKQLGMGYTMDTFRKAVKTTMGNDSVVGGVSTPQTEENAKTVETPKAEIKVGSTVKVNQGAKTYTGGGLATFVYNREHKVHQISGDRAVITYNGTIVAAIKVSDLITTDDAKVVETPKAEIKVGSTVRVAQGAKTYTGGGLASYVYDRDHQVKQISGDRVVITYQGTVVAAVKMSDLKIV